MATVTLKWAQFFVSNSARAAFFMGARSNPRFPHSRLAGSQAQETEAVALTAGLVQRSDRELTALHFPCVYRLLLINH